MKVLTAAQMREVDRRTVEMGVPSLILMENAGQRVVEFLERTFEPLSAQRIVVLCGKGNNGGDGLVVARQLATRIRPRALDVVLASDPAELRDDAARNFRMLEVAGCAVSRDITAGMRAATVVIDALLGTGLSGPPSGRARELIAEVNGGFPDARIVAVDIPSGLASDAAASGAETVRADYTVTFTAPKIGQVLPPNCDRVGRLHVAPIGSPASLYEEDDSIFLSLVEPRWFRRLFRPRAPGAHKGDFGHVLVVGGSRGKTGAAAMAGLAALRAGAGLVTVASAASAIATIAEHAPELMTEPLPETETGSISLASFDYGRFAEITSRKTVLALGPGIGVHPDTAAFARRVAAECVQPLVIDADGLNALAGLGFEAPAARVLTPHPGEMARLSGLTAEAIQADRVGAARDFALRHRVTLVLKGQRTVIAFADGRVWINPTGTPAMATGGAGDILTGLVAGLLAQFPAAAEEAVAAAVYLHGRAGELGAAELGEKALIATDLVDFLPAAMEECADIPDQF